MAKKTSKMWEILSIVGDFVTTFFTTVVVLLAIAVVAVKLLGWNLYSVDSYSMSPAYPIDSLVVVKPVEPEAIQVGDVITYVLNEDGVLVTHRVTAVNRSSGAFTTKGDANSSEDASPVLWGNVVGKVVLGIPFLGAPLRYLTAEENRQMVVIGIAALLALSFGWDLLSKGSKRKQAAQPQPEPEPQPPDPDFYQEMAQVDWESMGIRWETPEAPDPRQNIPDSAEEISTEDDWTEGG